MRAAASVLEHICGLRARWCEQPIDDLYLHMCQVVRMSRKHIVCSVHIGVANKTQYLLCSWALPNDSKHTEASFPVILTDTYLRVAQMPS